MVGRAGPGIQKEVGQTGLTRGDKEEQIGFLLKEVKIMEVIVGLGLKEQVAQIEILNMCLQIKKGGVCVRRVLPICLIKSLWTGNKRAYVINVEAHFTRFINAQISN
jgi:hypothetical protein